jgi:hypothetical protein
MMNRAVGITRTILGLLAIEMFVPGGTLILLTLLLAGRPGSPMQQIMIRRYPALFRALPHLTGRLSLGGNI